MSELLTLLLAAMIGTAQKADSNVTPTKQPVQANRQKSLAEKPAEKVANTNNKGFAPSRTGEADTPKPPLDKKILRSARQQNDGP